MALFVAVAFAGTSHVGLKRSGLSMNRQIPEDVLKHSMRLAQVPVRAQSDINIEDIFILDQPEGTILDNMSKSAYCLEDAGGFLYESEFAGYAVTMVETDDALYIHDLFSLGAYGFETGIWVKGEKTEGDTVALKQQAVYLLEDYDDYGEPIAEVLYAAKMKLTFDTYYDEYYGEEVTQVSIMAAEDPTIKFIWKDNTLTLADMAEDEIIGLAFSDGYFGGYGEMNSTFSAIDAKLVELPADAVAQDWQMKYVNGNGGIDGGLVKVAVAGNDVYLSNLPGAGDAWLKGSIEGDKVTFASEQYLGINVESNYHLFAYGAVMGEGYDPDYDEYVQMPVLAENVVFAYDATSQSMTSENGFIINYGNGGLSTLQSMMQVELRPYENADIAATPLDPVFVSYQPYTADWPLGIAMFTISMFDVDGNYLNPEKMYYNIYYDEEKVELFSDEYPGLANGTTDIPVTYEDGMSVFRKGSQVDFLFYSGGFEKFGVQLVYTGGGEVRKSKLVYYGEETGIEDVLGESEIESVTYVDLYGRTIAGPTNGIYVKCVKFTDGSMTVKKVAVK